MENRNQEIRDLLLRSFDLPLSEAEAQQLQEALSASEWLRAEQEQLVKMRALVGMAKPQPDPDFSNKVMGRIGKREITFTTLMVRLAPYVAAACILAFILTLSFIYFSEGSLMTDTLVGIEDLAPEDADYLVDLN